MSSSHEDALERASTQSAKRVEAARSVSRKSAELVGKSEEALARSLRSLSETAGIRPLT